jgi:hypothetical protein
MPSGSGDASPAQRSAHRPCKFAEDELTNLLCVLLAGLSAEPTSNR